MRKNKAVTAVIGVMLMVAITVAIAATFYVWVHGFQPKPEPHFQGWIYNAYDTQQTYALDNQTFHIWNVTLVPTYDDYTVGTNKTSYSMIFNGPAPPPNGVFLQLFYKEHDGIYEIYKVKSL